MDQFTNEERIEQLSSRTGMFPFNLVLSRAVKERIVHDRVPPISKWDEDLKEVWFIPRDIVERKTKNGRPFWIVKVIDNTSTVTDIRCWGIIKGKDEVHLNRPYKASLNYDPTWGFSTNSIYKNFTILG